MLKVILFPCYLKNSTIISLSCVFIWQKGKNREWVLTMQSHIICILTKSCCSYTSSLYSPQHLVPFIYEFPNTISSLSLFRISKPHTREQNNTGKTNHILAMGNTHAAYRYMFENFSEENTQKRYSICYKQSAMKAFIHHHPKANECMYTVDWDFSTWNSQGCKFSLFMMNPPSYALYL